MNLVRITYNHPMKDIKVTNLKRLETLLAIVVVI